MFVLTWYLKFCFLQGSRQSHLYTGIIDSELKNAIKLISPCELLHIGTPRSSKTFKISGTHKGICFFF